MPLRYIGRPTTYKGKFLFEILCNLKNFGVGRMVVRKSYLERYPESTYYIIKQAQPDMSDPELRKGYILADQVFRGQRSDGLMKVKSSYKKDWWLVPKEEESSMIANEALHKPKTGPEMLPMPPLLAKLYTDKLHRQGKTVKDDDLMLNRKISENRKVPVHDPRLS